MFRYSNPGSASISRHLGRHRILGDFLGERSEPVGLLFWACAFLLFAARMPHNELRDDDEGAVGPCLCTRVIIRVTGRECYVTSRLPEASSDVYSSSQGQHARPPKATASCILGRSLASARTSSVFSRSWEEHLLLAGPAGVASFATFPATVAATAADFAANELRRCYARPLALGL